MCGQLFRFSLLVITTLGLGACGAGEPAEPPEPPQPTAAAPRTASATLAPTEGNSVEGTVSFVEENGQVKVTAHITGLEPGPHGFHIHENGDCSAPDGTSAGGHFNPDGVDHGSPSTEPRHRGDLGNIEAGADGTAHHEMTIDFVTLQEGQPHSIIGRGLIVHAGEDDLTSQPTGAAGGRLACAVIEKN